MRQVSELNQSRSMPGNPLILELVQEILESNRTPEEVCANHPELLWEVRQQLRRAQKIEARLAELFPSSIDDLRRIASHRRSTRSQAEMTCVAGGMLNRREEA